MEVVFLIDPLGTYNVFINERDQSLPILELGLLVCMWSSRDKFVILIN